MSNRTDYNKFVKRIGLVGIVQTLSSFKGLIILPILTKMLPIADYGIWAQIIVTIALLHPIIQVGLDNAILRFLPMKDKKEIAQGVWTSCLAVFILGIIVSYLLYLLSRPFSMYFLQDANASYFIKLAAPLLLFETLNIITLGSFRVFGLIKRYSFAVIFRTVLEISLIAFFVLTGKGLSGAITALIITKVSTFLLNSIMIISYSGFVKLDLSILPEFIKYGIPLMPTLIFEYIISSSDRYIIGASYGAESVGIYSASYGLGGIIILFSTYILYILRPTIYGKYDKGDVSSVKTFLSYSWKYINLLTIPAAFGIAVLSRPLLKILTTEQFVNTGVVVIPLVALSMIFYAMERIFGSVVLLSKKSIVFLWVFGVSAVFNLVLNIILVPRYGVVAAAFTTVLAYFTAMIIMLIQSRKYLSFNIGIFFILKSILASVIMALILYVLKPNSIIFVLLSIILGALIYLLVLMILKGFTKKEMLFILDLIKTRHEGKEDREI